MTFKPNAVKRTITGTFHRPDGVASKGKIYLQFSDSVLGREEAVIYTPQKLEIALDENGSFTEDIAVTAPGLTTEELAELNDVQAARAQNLEDLAAVQESINTYLNKLAANQEVTQEETDQYNEDIETKKDLQVVSVELSKNYNELLDLQKILMDNIVRVKVTFEFTNPVNRSKVEFIIPPGTDPVDISRLPRV